MAFKFEETWAETFAIVLLVVGFLVSILLTNAVLAYVVVVLAGFLAGRIFFTKRFKEPIFPFMLMIVGFLLGYVLGGFWVSRFWTIIFFLASFGVSYYLHLKGILTVIEGKNFIK